MFLFHYKEIYYRLIYFNISLWISFFILYCNKFKLLYFLAPIDLFYTNIIDIFWTFFINILFFSLFINLPFLLYNFFFFMKPGLFENEYYLIKKFFLFLLSILSIYFIFHLFYFLTSLIIFSSSFNNEQLNMQISLFSYFNQITNFYYYFLFSVILIYFSKIKKISRKWIYLSFFTFLSIILTLDLFSLGLIFINYICLIEFSLLLYYIFKGL